MLRVLELPDGGQLIVETEDDAGEPPFEIAQTLEMPDPDRRTGAIPTSKGERIAMAGKVLQGQVNALAGLARNAVTYGGPDEVTVEAHVKFSGGVDFIPFIAKTGGEGGLKLTMKWKGREPSDGCT